jgi:hypothetical protein
MLPEFWIDHSDNGSRKIDRYVPGIGFCEWQVAARGFERR